MKIKNYKIEFTSLIQGLSDCNFTMIVLIPTICLEISKENRFAVGIQWLTASAYLIFTKEKSQDNHANL